MLPQSLLRLLTAVLFWLLPCLVLGAPAPKSDAVPGSPSGPAPSNPSSVPDANPVPSPRPPATRGQGRPEPVNLRAKRVIHKPGVTIAEGDVIVISEGAAIEAQYMEIDHATSRVKARGNVRILQEGDEISASSATYDLNSKQAWLQDAFGIARNLTFQMQPLQGELYFWSREAHWDGQTITLQKGIITTCDVPRPDWHYHASGDVVRIYPKDRLEISKARIFLGKRQLIGRPLVVVSLKDRRDQQNLIPQIGQTATDGYFIKETVAYSMGRRDWGRLHLDYFQKTGFGFGVEHNYNIGGGGGGNLSYYQLVAPPTQRSRYEVRNQTTYQFSPGFTGNFYANVSQYFSPIPALQQPTANQFQVELEHQGQQHRSRLTSAFYSQANVFNSYYQILQQNTLSERLVNHFEAQYVRQASGASTSYYLHTLDRLAYQGDIFDVDLLLENTTGVSAFRLNRLPELQVRSKNFEIGPIPLRFAMGLGQLAEQPSGANTGRSDLQLIIPDVDIALGTFGTLRAGAGFRQLFYSTGDSQYVSAARAGWIQSLGENVRTHVTYRIQQPVGFTPLQTDLFGKYHAITAGIEVGDLERLKLRIDMGRDLEFDRYYNLQARIDWTPAKRWRINVGTSYDPNFGQWRALDSNIRVPLSPTLSLQHYTLYNLTTKQLTYQDFMIQDDSHDWVTSLIYRSVQREWFLQVALKAFPFTVPSVGPDTRNPIVEDPRRPSPQRGLMF